jgi:hypothetical protein
MDSPANLPRWRRCGVDRAGVFGADENGRKRKGNFASSQIAQIDQRLPTVVVMIVMPAVVVVRMPATVLMPMVVAMATPVFMGLRRGRQDGASKKRCGEHDFLHCLHIVFTSFRDLRFYSSIVFSVEAPSAFPRIFVSGPGIEKRIVLSDWTAPRS